jgi:uncharacterized surface protein with fasciclin (FAS1) repeats
MTVKPAYIGFSISITHLFKRTISMKKIVQALALGASLSLGAIAVSAGQYTHQTITQKVVGNESFSTLKTAVITADLAETLSEGNYTVFAPINSAFAKLNEGTVESLLKPGSRSDLKRILLCHVVAGRVSAADLYSASEHHGSTQIETAGGCRIEVIRRGHNIYLIDENHREIGLIQTDIKASNGLIHSINTVILP